MTNELTHHGIKGQKWGIRRFQKKDGGLTSAGKKRYSDDTTNATKVAEKKRAMQNAKAKMAAAKSIKKDAKKDWDYSVGELSSATRMWTKSGDAISKTSFRNAKRSDKADKAYKDAKKAYKDAKKDYKKELAKENEQYSADSKKHKFIDKHVFSEGTQRQINRLLNENEGLTVSQARNTTYIEAGLSTAGLLLTAYGAYKVGLI